MNTRHIRYDQDSELLQVSYARDVETPDDCRKLSTIGTPDESTQEHQEFYHGWAYIGHVRYCQTSKNKLALLSFKHLKLTWVGINTYE